MKTLFVGCSVAFLSVACLSTEATKKATPDYTIPALELHRMLTSVETKPQKFEISASSPSDITGKNGLFVRIDPNDLETETGQPLGDKIQVELREITEDADFVFSDVRNATSNGKQLLSGGTYHIAMRSNGKTVRVRAGRALSIDFPRTSTKRMELFTSGRDTLQNLNWMPANQRFKRGDEDQFGPKQELDYYLPMSVNRLGWLSCAVFNRLNSAPSYVFDVKNDNYEFGKAFLVSNFGDAKVCIGSTMFFNGQDGMIFEKIPYEGRGIVVFTAIKNGRLYAYANAINVESTSSELIELKQMSPTELWELVRNLK